MQFERLALIGCGLMGGSFALALRENGCVKTIVGYSASENSRTKAREMGIIDTACNNVADAVRDADLVLLAVPVAATQTCLQAMRDALSPDALLMDVGSTKCDVVQAARATLGDRLPCFVPAHPIAGKEVAGIEHADASLYQDRCLVLTPLDETNPERTQRAHALWQRLGSRVVQLTANEHDAAFAAVSHLPHLLAFGLMQSIMRQPQGALYLSMAGPGFRDFSRIAGSDAKVWRDILLANREEVLHQSALMQQALRDFEQAMQTADGPALEHLIDEASRARRQWQAVK